MTKYSVQFVNNSTNPGSAMIFQGEGSGQLYSLAWMAKYNYPSTRVLFDWEEDYSFVWAETGKLLPGVTFFPAQVNSAELNQNNQITFSKIGGAYHFQDQTSNGNQGLHIKEDDTIAMNQASVGIGMSGSATFAIAAQPNMYVNFSPKPEYWITFGNYSKGEVLDTNMIMNKAQIQFPVNVYSMTATLNPDNTWTVEPTSNANARIVDELQAKK